MTFAFYTIDFAEKIGYQWVFVFFAIMGSVLAFIPVVVLMWKGREFRERLGKPRDVNVFDSMVADIEEDLASEKPATQ